jgi:hypothetical protein
LAFATRIASVLVGAALVVGTFFDFSLVGIKGIAGVGTFEARSTGCLLMGPVTKLSLGM